VLDGYLGGYSTGAATSIATGISPSCRGLEYLTIYIDQKVSKIGTGRIAEALLDSILEVRGDDTLREYVSGDFVARIRAEWPDILHDLHFR